MKDRKKYDKLISIQQFQKKKKIIFLSPIQIELVFLEEDREMNVTNFVI